MKYFGIVYVNKMKYNVLFNMNESLDIYVEDLLQMRICGVLNFQSFFMDIKDIICEDISSSIWGEGVILVDIL